MNDEEEKKIIKQYGQIAREVMEIINNGKNKENKEEKEENDGR